MSIDPELHPALIKYRKGMKELGRSLIILAAFQAIIGAVILAARFDPLLLAIVGVPAAVHLAMGTLLLNNQGWVNYVAAAWSVLLLVGIFYSMGLQADQPGNPASMGSCLGLLIAAAILFYSIRNIQALAKVRAAGLEP